MTTPLALRRLLACVLLAVGLASAVQAQPDDRIPFNDQELWLSGGNVAWVNFARDIGPGQTELAQFEEIFQDVQDSGGNSMRLWLHTTGGTTPAWSGTTLGEVTGPGVGTIEDLRAILDLAWQHEVGLQLCLWSFDMLNTRDNPASVTDRAHALLTDAELTQTYVDNALVPMVEALEDHPAIIAWEIFNEPEGMSNEHGWSHTRHVPMADIQRFINMTAGAIHRADPDAQVTNGSWAFIASSDTPTASTRRAADLSTERLEAIRRSLSARYGTTISREDARRAYDQLHAGGNFNYYRDDRLIEAGGDPDGTLDFYNVHYYEWAGEELSPFHHSYDHWGLDKPLVIGEFYMGQGDDGDPDAVYGIPYESLYLTLFVRGYAGALAWQWFDYPDGAEGVVNWPRMLENMATMYERHREAVDLDPGLRILSFTASRPAIETGQESELSWIVGGAGTVSIDGAEVDSVGTMTVAPTETTTYELVATDADEPTQADTAHVTVSVVPPEEINRALDGPAFASTIETCCGATLSANLAVDGDPETRWSSEWQDGFADEDPDDEWIYVDLGQAYDLLRVVLDWEAAYGFSYDLEVSYDGRLWTPVYEERSGDGGTDEIVFDGEGPSGRYVRMRGLERATTYGYSLYEMEVYGLQSGLQPPTADFSAPAEGAIVAPGGDLSVRAEATDPDGTVQQVVLRADGEELATDTEAPYTASWTGMAEGAHVLTAITTDSDGLQFMSADYPVFAVDTSPFLRYEAEDAVTTGTITVAESDAASGGSYLDMQGDGTITFEVQADVAGAFLITFGHNLAYDTPKSQFVVVNGERLGEVRFNGQANTWQERGLMVPLQVGTNTITIEPSWGWMYFDYLAVSDEALTVGTEGAEQLDGLALAQNAPNPFGRQTAIAYTLETSGPVRLEVFDVTGRRVATLVNAVQAAGTHTATFDGEGLANGVYLYRLQAGTTVETRQMLLVR